MKNHAIYVCINVTLGRIDGKSGGEFVNLWTF